MPKTVKLDQLKNLISPITGFVTGVGGFNEWSIIGMATWTILHYAESWAKYSRRFYWQDIIIISISLLCVWQWSYNDPALSSDDSGLTVQEFIKICVWLVFGLTMVRAPRNAFYRTINGIALGIGLFALSSTIGALITQPFQGSRFAIFNIFTGRTDAGSTFIAYSCIASTLLLIITRSSMAWLGSIACITLGMQAVNRHSLFVGLIVACYLTTKFLSSLLFGSKENDYRSHAIKTITFISIALLLTGASIYLLSSHTTLDAIDRFADFRGSDARLDIYSTGYLLLGKSITTNSFEIMQNVNQQVVGRSPSWWHSLPLDSARSSGWLGLILSIIWICGILKGMIQASFDKGKYILVGTLTLLTLLTSIPVGLGSYELLGSLTLTQAMISSDKV
jgi:hypothetical protein